MNDLRTEITRVRDAYRGQMKFCDIEALGYFREFVRRLDDVLASVDERPQGQDEKQLGAQHASAVPERQTPNPSPIDPLNVEEGL